MQEVFPAVNVLIRNAASCGWNRHRKLI